MGFDCTFFIDFVAKDAEASFERYAVLLFAPQIGMEFDFSPDGDTGWMIAVRRVRYLTKDNWLEVYCEPVIYFEGCNCPPESECCRFDPESMTSDGWTMNGAARRLYQRSHDVDGILDRDKTFEAAWKKRATGEWSAEQLKVALGLPV